MLLTKLTSIASPFAYDTAARRFAARRSIEQSGCRSRRGTMRRRNGISLAIVFSLLLSSLAIVLLPGGAAAAPADKINHVIVIYQENWGFDSLYGNFPGANGFASMGTVTQVDKTGKPYTTLPQPIDTTLRPPAPDPRFPANLPVAPFNAAQYVPPDQKTGDLVHRFYQEQYQIDSGKMDMYVAWSDAAGLV